MATTNLGLDEHWEVFIKNQLESGHYGSVNEVIQAGLRELEERISKLNALRAALIKGEESGIVEDYSIENLIEELDKESPK